MKNFLLLPSVSCSALAATHENADDKRPTGFKRRSDLPIYSEVPVYVEKSVEETANSAVLDVVRSVRKEACKIAQTANSFADRCEKFVNTGIAHSYGSYANTVEYLREEKNVLPRFGAVIGGVLFGYIFNLKKGFFKRLFYSTASGAIVASVCYPSEAKQYVDKSVQHSKKYTIIGYHFLNGVTKDLGGFELPAFPLKFLNSEDSTKKDSRPN